MANIDMKNEGLGPEREHTRKTEGNDSISEGNGPARILHEVNATRTM